MTVAAISHIEIDDEGVPRIAGHGLAVKGIAIAHLKDKSAEQMLQDWPALTLAQVYAALAYYYDHKSEINAQIEADIQRLESAKVVGPNPGNESSLEQLKRRLQEQGKLA